MDSSAFSFVPAPSELSPPTQYDVGEDWVMVQWNALGPSHLYEMQWKTESDESWTTASSTLSGNIVKKKGLSANTNYIFRVRANDTAGGWGPFSEPSKPLKPLGSSFVKLAPPVVWDTTHDSITISWDEWQGASSYEVEVNCDQTGWVNASSSVAGKVFKKKNLAPGSSCQFRVRPIVAGNASAFSSPSDPISTSLAAPYFVENLGSKLVDNKENVHSIHEISDKIVGLYFASHASAACNLFTPQLIQFYHQMLAAGKQFTVVLVSLDPDSHSFEVHLESTPFLAIPYSEQATRQKIQSMCMVDPRICPRLMIFNSSGGMVERAATSSVLNVKTFEEWESAPSRPL
eukprot:c4728_g1_i1.p1 GENE.c4728_g1_i1~~c4728_g1_i1.p1  ORF type:complete len:346 (+),score=91.21 c4728_g1_i1:103-1140(+)